MKNNFFYRLKGLVTDFFNKVPAIILIPGIILFAFGFAASLIWLGTKVAVIEVREPYESNSNVNAKKKANSNKNGNDDLGESEYYEYYNEQNNGSGLNNGGTQNSGNFNPADQSSGNSSNSGGLGGQPGVSTGGQTGSTSGSENPDSQNSGSSSSSSSSSKSEEDEGNTSSRSGSSSTSSSQSNQNLNSNTNVEVNCTYPSGDAETWWRRSPKAQRDCYIMKNGRPKFVDTAYFCDYNNDDDCYIR